MIADLAILSLGATTVPIHTTLSPAITKHILQHSETTVAVISKKQAEKIDSIHSELPLLKTVITIDDTANSSWQELLKTGAASSFKPTVTVALDDVASIIYTSGTTAEPKGVMLTHGNFMSNAASALAAVKVTEHDTLLSFLPLSHVLERTTGTMHHWCVVAAVLPMPKVLKHSNKTFEKLNRLSWYVCRAFLKKFILNCGKRLKKMQYHLNSLRGHSINEREPFHIP